MYVKKSISLLLSGALFASLCTGCSQTTMEHHFFTDTETETEYITPIEWFDVTVKLQELENLLKKHEIQLVTHLSSHAAQAAWGPNWNDISITEINKEVLLNISQPTVQAIYYNYFTEIGEQEPGTYEYLSGVLTQIESLYNIFNTLTADEWDDFKDKLLNDKFGLMIHGYQPLNFTMYYFNTCLCNGGLPSGVA